MKLKLAVGVSVFAFLGAPASARTLHWRSIEVQATLDGDGLLHVLERQNIVFDGDWNGGERRFRLEPGQQLTLSGVARIDPETGARTPLSDGNLSEVDHYSFTDEKTLRWRSRLPSDPPFSNREIDYLLDYSLSGILEKRGGSYRLNHDFAFSQRDGAIDHFTLDFGLDSSWKPETALPGHWEAGPLLPGRGFVVSASLRTTRPVAPSAARTIPILADRRLAQLLVGVAVLLFGLHYWLHDRARGRFAPLPAMTEVDGAWLKANVFDLLPEEVGTAIDDDVGSPEVAAVIARLVSEKKLESETTKDSDGKSTLRLTRRAPDHDFQGYEKALVDGLFFGEKSVTPEDVRAHYKSSGFNPAQRIEKDLRAKLSAKGAFADAFKPASAWRTLLFFLAAVGFGVATILHHVAADAPATFIFLFASLFCGGLGLMLAKGSAESFTPWNARLVFGVALILLPWIGACLAPAVYSATLFAAFTFLALMFASSAFHMAMSRDGAARMERRRRLATAKRYFQEQLTSAHPKLEDSWFPYLLALGLGSGVDRWSKSFGGASGRSSGTSFGGSSSSSSSGAGWTGGGGSFGGAGASAGWAAAVGGFSAGVASPSSSSGGGGGSSGGGGGGGW